MTGDCLGIELLSVFGLDPVAHVHLAADLGCGHISSGLTPAPFNPHGYPPWSPRDDAALRRAPVAAMRERGVRLSLGEGFGVRPGVDMRDRAADLDLMAELGAQWLGGVGMEPDAARADDQSAALVAALPDHVAIGLEVPMFARAAAGVPPIDRLRPAVAAARLLLEQRTGDGS